MTIAFHILATLFLGIIAFAWSSKDGLNFFVKALYVAITLLGVVVVVRDATSAGWL